MIRADRRKPKFDTKKVAGLHSGPAWRPTIDFFEREVVPIFNKLYDEQLDDEIKKPLRKYLIISIPTFIEQYFINQARRVVDQYGVNMTDLFKDEICIPITHLDRIVAQQNHTKGNIVASSYNFADLTQINELFTNLLKLNLKLKSDLTFLDVIQKVQRSNRVRYIFHKPIDIDYEEFKEAFRLRNAIVHEMKDIELSNDKLRFLWENAINIVDASNMIMMPENKKTVKEIVVDELKKQARTTTE